MTQFDRVIPPGGEGKIKVSVDTKGRGGKVRKTVRVHTNDPNKKVVVITIKAFVKNPINLSSKSVRLYGKEGQGISKMVQVKAMLKTPLKLEKEEFTLSDRITCTLEEVEKGKMFRIRFTLLPGAPERERGYLKLKTNYSEKPVIVIPVVVRIVEGRSVN